MIPSILAVYSPNRHEESCQPPQELRRSKIKDKRPPEKYGNPISFPDTAPLLDKEL